MSSNENEVSSSLRMKALTEIRLSRKRKRQEINIANLSSIKNRKHDEPRARAANTMRRIIDVDLVISELKNGCRKCKSQPLLLTNAIQDDSLSVNRLGIVCPNCKEINFVLLHSSETEEKMVLGCIHTCQGHSHLEAFMSIVGLPCMNKGKFEQLERRVPNAVERTAGNSCSKWMEKEKSLGSGFPVQKTLKGAYDTSW